MKYSILLLAILLFAPLHASASSCNTLQVSGYIGWVPLLIQDSEEDPLTGIAIDLTREIATDLKLPIEFKKLPWKRSLQYLEKVRIDIILGIYKTRRRSKIYHYTQPILRNQTRVFVLKSKVFKFEQLQDLIGKHGEILLGASFDDEFDQFARKHLTITGQASFLPSIKKLLKGNIDYMLSDHTDVLYSLQKYGYNEQIIALPKVVSTLEVYFAISKTSACAHLAKDISERLEALKTAPSSLKYCSDIPAKIIVWTANKRPQKPLNWSRWSLQ